MSPTLSLILNFVLASAVSVIGIWLIATIGRLIRAFSDRTRDEQNLERERQKLLALEVTVHKQLEGLLAETQNIANVIQAIDRLASAADVMAANSNDLSSASSALTTLSTNAQTAIAQNRFATGALSDQIGKLSREVADDQKATETFAKGISQFNTTLAPLLTQQNAQMTGLASAMTALQRELTSSKSEQERLTRLEADQQAMTNKLAELQTEREQLVAQVADLRSHQAAKATGVNDVGTEKDETPPLTRDVQFTAVAPETAPVGVWNTLLFYAHVVSALEAVRADAGTFEAVMGGAQRSLQVQSSRALARGVELTIVPECDGVTFEPEYLSLKWLRDMQRREFTFKGEHRLEGITSDCAITVYVGPLIVATLRIGLSFGAQTRSQQHSANGAHKGVESSTSLYRHIFVSYSHEDDVVVEACRNVHLSIGDEVFMDRYTLKPGQLIGETLQALIEKADIFQLFWSEQAANSQPVHEEWTYALEHSKGKGFIRPVYWKKPHAPFPPELTSKDIWFRYVPLPVLQQTGSPSNPPPARRGIWARLFGRDARRQQ